MTDRAAPRDPRKEPLPGDILRYGKTTSEVIEINEHGKILSKANGTLLTGPLKYWLSWAKKAEVVKHAD